MKSMYVIMYNGHPCAVTKNEKDAKKCVEEKNAARKGEEQFGPEYSYKKCNVWCPEKHYTLSYTSRFGYSIEYGEKIENALIEISKNDEMLYDEIQDHIRQMFKDSIDEYGTDGIQFERWAYGECDEYFDSTDSDSESRFPDELVKDADKLMDMLREYIREYKEASRLVITDIDWDTDGEKTFGLPKNIKVFISRLLHEDETEESVDENELKDRAIDYLSDEYGYCISGVGDIEREAH